MLPFIFYLSLICTLVGHGSLGALGTAGCRRLRSNANLLPSQKLHQTERNQSEVFLRWNSLGNNRLVSSIGSRNLIRDLSVGSPELF